MHVSASSRGAKASKRVMAPEQQHESARVTRQKTRVLAAATSPDLQQVLTIGLTTATPTPEALAPVSSPTLQQDQVDISEEGKCIYFLLCFHYSLFSICIHVVPLSNYH